jgi:hypothetical protein
MKMRKIRTCLYLMVAISLVFSLLPPDKPGCLSAGDAGLGKLVG